MMKVLTAIAKLVQSLIAKSFLWTLIAFLACIPLGLFILRIFDQSIDDNEAFFAEINHRVDLLFAAFCLTCFSGILIARMLAVSIRVIAQKQLKAKGK